VLLITGLLILILDMVFHHRDGRREWLPFVGIAGLVGALVAASLLWGRQESLLSGMMAVDSFALFFKVVAGLSTLLVILASWDYFRGKTPYEGEFYGLLVLAALAITLAASSTDLIMIYLSMEFLSIASYILVGYLRDDPKSNEGAIKYFLYGAIASGIMLYGMSLLYGVTGTTSLAEIAKVFAAGKVAGDMLWLVLPALVMLLAGFGFKIALVPFHQWAPDAYEGAPTPVTAFLSVGPKAAGFAILIRVFLAAFPAFQVDWVAVLAAISMVTMTLGNVVALKQTNIKRMLAYSSIAHAGYILIGFASVALKSPSIFNGVNGVLLYLLGYLFTNVGAFVAVIAFENGTGSNQISDYAGLVKRSPWLAGTLFVLLLSLTGIPPTAGFLGKFFVFAAAINVQFWALALVGIINSVIAAFYYLNVARYMFFLPAAEESRVKISPALAVALGIATAVTLLIGLYPQPFIDFATQSVRLLSVF
jgi:proton-translocating NADH-quinone oxidoreductase chain N